MTIGDRIKQLRKSQHLTQAEFGERIGLKATAIGMYENGQRNVTEQSIVLIVQTFTVNETWLRFGTGSMFEKSDFDLVKKVIKKYHMSENQQRLMLAFLAMDEDKREQVATAFFDLVHHLKTSTNLTMTTVTSDSYVQKELKNYEIELNVEKDGQMSSPSVIGKDDTVGEKNA